MSSGSASASDAKTRAGTGVGETGASGRAVGGADGLHPAAHAASAARTDPARALPAGNRIVLLLIRRTGGLYGNGSSGADEQAVAEHLGKPRAVDFLPRLLRVVRNAVEVHDARRRVVDRVGGRRVAVPRLPDRARVDEVPAVALELQARA